MVYQDRSTTEKDIIDRALRITSLGETGIATAGSTSTIVDTARLQSTQFSATRHVGGWGRISKDAAGSAAAPEREFSPITTYAPSSGTITVNPVLSAGVAVGDEYQLCYMNPSKILAELTAVLEEDVFVQYKEVLSEVLDFNMEAGGVTNWTLTNASATKSVAEPTLGGRQVLRLTATSANGQARSELINVRPGATVVFGAVAAPSTASDLKCILYDETNGAELSSLTSTYLIPVRFIKQVTIPTTCYKVSIRLVVVSNGAIGHFDDVVFFDTEAQTIAMPSWVKSHPHLTKVFKLDPTQIADGIFYHELVGDEVTSEWTPEEGGFGRGQVQLFSAKRRGVGQTLFIDGIRNDVAFTSSTGDTKYIDEYFVATGLAYKMLKIRSLQGYSSEEESKYFEEKLKQCEAEWATMKRNQAQRLTPRRESQPAWGNYRSNDEYGGRF